MNNDPSFHDVPFTGKATIAISFSIFLIISIFFPLPTAHAQTSDFSLRTVFKGESLPQGSGDNYNEVNVTSLNGFSGSVTLMVDVSPLVSNGPAVSLYSSTLSVTPGGSSYTIISVSTTPSTQLGNYTVTVTGVSGTSTHATSFWLYISVPYMPPDFIVTPKTSTVTSTLTPHSVQNVSDNLTLTSLNGFSGTVTLSFRSDPGPSVLISPSSVTLAPAGTALAKLTIQPFFAGNYSVTVTGSIPGYSNRSTTVRFNILPPASDVAILSYRLDYNAKPSIGETLLLTSNFANQGAALITITGLSFNLGFGSFNSSSSLPMNVTSGQSKALFASIRIPSSAQLGNQSLVATLEWKYYAPGQGFWFQGPTRYISGSFSVAEAPSSGLAGNIDQLIGLAESFGPWLIVADVAAASAASLIIILRVRKRQTSLRPF